MKVEQIIDEMQASLTKLRKKMRLTGTAGECRETYFHNGPFKPDPDPLHVRVAKALGHQTWVALDKEWHSNLGRYVPEGCKYPIIPDYPNDLVAAMGALEEYSDKSSNHHGYIIQKMDGKLMLDSQPNTVVISPKPSARRFAPMRSNNELVPFLYAVIWLGPPAFFILLNIFGGRKMSSSLKKLEQRVRKKIRHQRSVADLEDALGRVVTAQRNQATAFRETVDNMQADFKKLTARIKELEKKLEGTEVDMS